MNKERNPKLDYRGYVIGSTRKQTKTIGSNIPAEDYDEIKAHAEKHYGSINKMIIALIAKDMESK